MEISQAIVLGLIQGLGEFLPISSSGHLVLVPWLFNWKDPGLAFSVALHFGTLLALLWYFKKEWYLLIIALFSRKQKDSIYNKKLLGFLVLATIPGVLAGFFFDDYAKEDFRNPLLIASTLSIAGFLLFWADKKLKAQKTLGDLSWKSAIIIGLAQAIAIVPGVSRSGATITVALIQKFDRTSAARFSFLLSTPIIFGATLMQAKDFFQNQVGLMEITGIATAAISSYFAIAWMIVFIEKVSYKIFFWYRLVLAVLIVFLFLFRS